MTTVAAQVTSAGITAPDYADILAELQAAYYSIYGADAVLDPSTQDGQLLAIFAQAIFDCNQIAVAIYNAFSPSYAQGAGLSSLVKINGLARQASTASTASVTVVGSVGTTITGGQIGDDQNLGTVWNLPSSVTIPGGGTITVTATCNVNGAVSAAPATLVNILTPTNGWQSVTNPSAAVPGAPVEQDAQLRQRQALSTSLPGETVVDGIYAAVANVTGVTEAAIFENSTDVTDVNGLPPHSISVVAFGAGTPTAIGQAILNKKTPGCDTFGTTSVVVSDSLGVPKTINYQVGAKVPITVTLTIKALTGYQATTGALIQGTLVAYLNTLAIGENSFWTRLFAPSNLSGDAATSSSGLTQAQLDALASTFTVLAITQSRAAPPPETTVTGGPYNAGTSAITVVSTGNIFQGAQLGIILDNATTLNTIVTSVTGPGAIDISPAVPVGRQILNGANVYLTLDVTIKYYEQASGAVANVTVVAT